MRRLTLNQRIAHLGPYKDAVEWLGRRYSLPRAWRDCKDGSWMLWLAGKACGPPDSDSRRRLVLCVCDVAEQAMPAWEACYPGDRRPQEALRVTRAWARQWRVVTLGDVRRAAFAACAAADAADAAYAAAYAAFATCATDAAFAARAVGASTPASVDIVRQHYPEPPAEVWTALGMEAPCAD